MIKGIINFYLAAGLHKRLKEIKRIYANPVKLQEEALFSILDKAGHTEFGRKYGFSSIKSVKTYQQQLPLFRYNDIRPWIEKTIKGKSNVLWQGRILNFALTSGTTSGNKYIPISQELIDTNRKAALDCAAFYLKESGEKSILNGRVVFLGGSTALGRLESGAFAGDLSGIISKHIPFMLRCVYEPGGKLASISDWERKIIKIAQKEVDVDIKGVFGIPSWLLVFFKRLLKEASRKKGRNINTVAEVWPGLSLLVHGGVGFKPYRHIFDEVIGKKIYHLETYPASEAFIAIQDRKDEAGLLLMLDYGIFYEFIPEEEIKKQNPARLTIADVEIDKNYAIVVTNNSGLYSYLLGDTVKFTELNPPRLIVTGRVENFLSAFGEHLIVEEAEDAVSYACDRTNSEIEEFTTAPFFPGKRDELPYHQWLIEFRKRPRDLEEFARLVDEKLKEENDDYKIHRGKNLSIGEPQIIELTKGTFYNWMKSEGKLGGQHKVPRLKNDRSIAGQLLKGRLPAGKAEFSP
ncbi:MAG: GH3 auxin-responsive promoter family protein [Candidatus Omnitrophota bacterium]|nr:GH3 auxin-responsive promoter family protein [Candidatus Omnitrophota bacterium]